VRYFLAAGVHAPGYRNSDPIMHQAEIIVLLLTAVGVLAVLAHKIALPYPIVLVLGGLALSFVPRLPAVNLNPDVVFYFILPALIILLRCSRRGVISNEICGRYSCSRSGWCWQQCWRLPGSRIPLCRRFHGRLLLPSAQLSPRQTRLRRRRSFAGSAFLIGYR